MYKIRAPELEPYAAWLNTTRPLTLKDLRGQLVILDFWTYCCVNCMHVIPVLRDLERRHAADPLVVIGVHSAKFDAEASPERIADAVARYGIEHPVVVDRDMELWHRYAVRSWPTLVFLRPDGTVAAVAPGEPDADLLERFVSEQLAEARANGTLAKEPLHVTRLAAEPEGTLAYPGKVSVAHDGRIAVSDSGHHRVLVATRDGRVLHAIGTGERGLRDGAFDACAFDDPQGVAWDGDVLWICDTRNHAVRRADLRSRTVTTFAGTGHMGAGPATGRAKGTSVELRSPWDVQVDGGTLYIAMAGSHQLWEADKASGEIEPFAGSGREALTDGTPEESAFAQPSGLAMRGRVLYVADSETSAVRAVDLERDVVETLVGAGLFDFGDVDGPAERARLQHALGVAVAADGAVIVADTYNDRLRRIDVHSERVGTFYRGEGQRALREPAGIATDPVSGFVVADTNNHRLVRITDDGQWDREVELVGAPAARRGDLRDAQAPAAGAGEAAGWFTESLEPDVGSELSEGRLLLSLTLRAPDGWKFADGSDARAAFEVSRRSDLLELDASAAKVTAVGDEPVVIVANGRVNALPGPSVPSELLVTVDAVLCSAGAEARCVPTRAWFRLPLVLARAGGHVLGYNLPFAPSKH